MPFAKTEAINIQVFQLYCSNFQNQNIKHSCSKYTCSSVWLHQQSHIGFFFLFWLAELLSCTHTQYVPCICMYIYVCTLHVFECELTVCLWIRFRMCVLCNINLHYLFMYIHTYMHKFFFCFQIFLCVRVLWIDCFYLAVFGFMYVLSFLINTFALN